MAYKNEIEIDYLLSLNDVFTRVWKLDWLHSAAPIRMGMPRPWVAFSFLEPYKLALAQTTQRLNHFLGE